MKHGCSKTLHFQEPLGEKPPFLLFFQSKLLKGKEEVSSQVKLVLVDWLFLREWWCILHCHVSIFLPDWLLHDDRGTINHGNVLNRATSWFLDARCVMHDNVPIPGTGLGMSATGTSGKALVVDRLK